MFRLKESIHIQAPIERCFLLSTSVDLVRETLKMRPVAGRISGHVMEGDRVWWRGWQFGLPAFHHSLISHYERPAFFQDRMEKGFFSRFEHDHRFTEVDGYTLLVDVVRFSLPMGAFGKAVGKAIVVPHILGLLSKRFQLLKRLAEGPDWQRYLDDEGIGADAATAKAASI